MEVGVVKIADDDDFDRLVDLCQSHDGWRQDYDKNETTVWTRSNEASDFRMVKVSLCRPVPKHELTRAVLGLPRGPLGLPCLC